MQNFRFARWIGLRSLVPALLVGLLAACGGGGGGGGGGGACGVEPQKQFVLSSARDWYLFLNELPASVDLAAYASAADLLNALTAQPRAEGKDRYFSYLTTVQAEQAFFGEGQTIAFGLRTQLLPGADSSHFRLFLAKVEPGSPAAEAGFVRGDEILAIGDTPQNLTPISSYSGTPDQVAWLISVAFGPSSSGVSRAFSVRTPGGSTVARSMTKRLITLEPVPITQTYARTGLTPVGYIAFESFITPAETKLRDAFASFQAQGVRDLIVDLRYNGGGLISVAQLLGNLLATANNNQVMFRTLFNTNHPEQDQTALFAAEPQSLPAQRIAFIATGATASASELVINSLAPYAQVAIIGAQTFGKPVGQIGLQQPGCDTVLRLIAFKDVNRDGYGDFYNGLPASGFAGGFCAAADDLSHARGDLAEASTSAARWWIDNNTCPAAKALAAAPSYPVPRQPTVAQEHQPGLF